MTSKMKSECDFFSTRFHVGQIGNFKIIFCFKCCYRVQELPDNKTTLYVENDAFDNLSVSIEPYSQPVVRPRASLKNTYSYS